MERVFLGWDRPVLAVAVEYVLDHFGGTAGLDLSNLLIAVPGGRAGRRLEELLLEKAEARDPAWIPPRILTLGRLPETLYRLKQPLADDLVQPLAWSWAIDRLRASAPEALEHLLPHPPDNDDFAAREAIGKMLAQLHRELAADGLDFRDVVRHCRSLENAEECRRWETLAQLQEGYLEKLDSLKLWDLQTARLYAIEHRECRTEKEILLVGTVDMNRTQRRMLDQVSDRVTSLVFAPEAMSEEFDAHGCVRPKRWREREIPIDDAIIEVVDHPADQATAVVRWLADLDGKYSASEISLGVPSEEIVPFLHQQLSGCGIDARYGPGVPMNRASVFLLLESLAEYLQTRSFESFAALVRHPDVERFLFAHVEESTAREDWISQLDRYRQEYLPATLDRRALSSREGFGALSEVLERLEEWIAVLFEDTVSDGESFPERTGKKPADWQPAISRLILALYDHRPYDPGRMSDRLLLGTAEEIHQVLRQAAALPEELSREMSISEMLHLVLRRLQGQRVAPPPASDAIEMLGWLELAWDDAPALAVTMLNEGLVPSSVSADLFLPDRMRQSLGLEDNHRRYARDAYALSMMLASKRELRLIAGRRALSGDPLAPSRLLFAAPSEVIARRVLHFFRERPEQPHLLLPGALQAGKEQSTFAPPLPLPLAEPVESMRVTEFRDYLACPYRYYLRHRLRLETLTDQAEELDAAAFGSLLHEVLFRFGSEKTIRDATDASAIEGFLQATLDLCVTERYGRRPIPAVGVQVEFLRLRLTAFARWQADWASRGHRIARVEFAPRPGDSTVEVDGRPVRLRGRIDRIDYHQESDKWYLFDYKSSETAKKPEKVHQKDGEWIDLQLPLYRYLFCRSLEPEARPELGYIVLPKDVEKTGQLLADWSEEELADADRTARRVIRDIRDQKYWPMAKPPPPFAEAFSAICMDHKIFLPGTEME